MGLSNLDPNEPFIVALSGAKAHIELFIHSLSDQCRILSQHLDTQNFISNIESTILSDFFSISSHQFHFSRRALRNIFDVCGERTWLLPVILSHHHLESDLNLCVGVSNRRYYQYHGFYMGASRDFAFHHQPQVETAF